METYTSTSTNTNKKNTNTSETVQQSDHIITHSSFNIESDKKDKRMTTYNPIMGTVGSITSTSNESNRRNSDEKPIVFGMQDSFEF